MDIYEELGVKKVVNAAGTYTVVGATRMSDETLEAMRQAASSYVSIEALQEVIHERVAKMTHNEAAYICNSCSTALYLCAAACISKKQGKKFKYIDNEIVSKSEFVGIWSQHIPYDHAIEQLGAKMRFIGYTNPTATLTKEDLEMSFNENTVGVYFAPRTPRGYVGKSTLNLEDVIEVAHKYGLPVIVDAAAQLPPKSNLWTFTEMGGDMVTFSGGKDLSGPQASGLVVGKKEYIDIVSKIGFPNYDAGRLMKIGREEIIALYSAIKQYMENDEEKRLVWCESEIKKLKELVDCEYFTVERCWPNQAGQPLPRAFVRISDKTNISGDDLSEMLMEFNPSVFCFSENQNGVFINPMCMKNGDMEYVAEKLNEIKNILKKRG